MRDHLPVRGSIRNKLIAELAVKDFNRIRPHLERITLPQHERLLRPGAPTEYAYFPESGMVSLILSLEEGHVASASQRSAQARPLERELLRDMPS